MPNGRLNEKIANKLSTLPHKSGVYLMLDKNSKIIYIGKAKILANRVRQYFQNSSSKTDKVMAMVENIDDLSYIITNTELDALALESNLIKKHQPHYNILLKDDKSHPYLKIDFKEDFPNIEIVRRVKSDGAKYWGPFFGGIRASELVELIQSAFMIRACKGKKFLKNHRPCLNYHIELCSAPCSKLVTKDVYREQLQKVASFLNGNDEEIRSFLLEKMAIASKNEKFEQALIYRERLKSLDKISRRLVTNIPRDSNYDVFGYATNNLDSVISVLTVRAGKTIGLECFSVKDTSFDPSECISSFMTQYYNHSRIVPDDIILPTVLADAQVLEEYFYGQFRKRANISVPLKGVKKQLLDTAELNAEDYLEKSKDSIARENDMTFGAVKQLKEFLSLDREPRRIECFDISNFGGTETVAGMVVFTNGRPDKKSYRRFKIRTVEGANDFQSMSEAIKRRMTKLSDNDIAESFGARPDLIVVDGGKGQLSSALEAMSDLGESIPIISLAKKEEEVFVPHNSFPVFVPRSSFALKLLQRIRDEAHRYSITYHRTLRNTRYQSSLEDIEGVGAKRRTKLLRHFRSVEAIKSASIESLKEVEGISKSVAEKIYSHFHKNPN